MCILKRYSKNKDRKGTYTNIYTHTHTHTHREREREKKKERKRERKRKRETERDCEHLNYQVHSLSIHELNTNGS